MLQEIKIKNFKSFKEEAELSFEAYSDDTNELRFVCNNDVYQFEEIVIPKGTMFYGYIENNSILD